MLFAAAAGVAALSFTVCGCGQKPLEPGSPAFNWAAAKSAYKSGDYARAFEFSVAVSEKESEFRKDAQPMALALGLSRARAAFEVAEKITEASTKSKTGILPFLRLANEQKTKAQPSAMKFLEVVRPFLDQNKAGDVKLVFEPPKGELEDPPQYKKMETGILPAPAESEEMVKAVDSHELLLLMCRLLGAPKNPDKAREAYQNGEATVKGRTFLMETAQGLYDIGEMFGPKKLNQPTRILVVIYDEALEALALLKGDKEADALAKKVTDKKKKLPAP